MKHSPVPPTAFTERGLYMLATILKSKQAVQTTIAIIDTFAQVRKMARTMEALQNVSGDIELQAEHSLPVNIIVGGVIEGLKKLTFEYELIDYHLVAWLLNKGTQYYTGLPAEEIMEDDD